MYASKDYFSSHQGVNETHATISQLHMLFTNVFLVHNPKYEYQSKIVIVDGEKTYEFKSRDLMRWINDFESVYIRRSFSDHTFWISRDQEKIFHLSCRQFVENDHLCNFGLPNETVIFTHIIPSSPEFRIKRTLSLNEITQEFTLCFVQPFVARLFKIQMRKNRGGPHEVTYLGARTVVFRNEVKQRDDIRFVPYFDHRFNIVGVQLWLNGISYDLPNFMPSQNTMSSDLASCCYSFMGDSALVVESNLNSQAKTDSLPPYQRLFILNQLNRLILSCVPNFVLRFGEKITLDNFNQFFHAF